jgi:hypothetical protein
MLGTGPRLGPRCRSGAGSQAPGTQYRVPDAGRNARLMLRSTRTWSMPDTGCTMQDTRYRMERCSPSLSCILHLAYPVCGFFGTGTGNSVEVPAFHPGIRCQAPGFGYRLPGTGYRIRAEGRIPSTEDRAQLPGLHLASRIHSPVSRTRIIALWPYARIAVLSYCPIAFFPDPTRRPLPR